MPRNEIEEIYGRAVASYFIGPQFKYVRQHFFVELNAENTQLLMFRCTAIDVYLEVYGTADLFVWIQLF